MRAPYEPFLGGELQADVAIYYDQQSMYDPTKNGVPVGEFVGWEGAGRKGVSVHTGTPSWVGLRFCARPTSPTALVTNVNLENT